MPAIYIVRLRRKIHMCMWWMLARRLDISFFYPYPSGLLLWHWCNCMINLQITLKWIIWMHSELWWCSHKWTNYKITACIFYGIYCISIANTLELHHSCTNPDSRDHGANMGSIWARQDSGGPLSLPHEPCYLGLTHWYMQHQSAMFPIYLL